MAEERKFAKHLELNFEDDPYFLSEESKEDGFEPQTPTILGPKASKTIKNIPKLRLSRIYEIITESNKTSLQSSSDANITKILQPIDIIEIGLLFWFLNT